MMRTTVTLDDDVARAARELARTSGKRLGQVLSELARRGLRAPAPRHGRGGFPTFDIPREAEVIPADRTRRLMEEDAL